MPIYSKRPKTARIGDSYYVFNGGESQGPYDLPFVQAMVLSGMLPADVSISTDGRSAWKRLDTLVPAQNLKIPATGGTPTPPPPMPGRMNPPPVPKKQSSGKGLLLTAAIIGGLAFLGHLSSQQTPPVQPPSYQQVSAPQADTSTYQQPPPAPAAAVDTSTAYQPPPAPATTYTPAPAVQDTSATTSVPTSDTSTPSAATAYSPPPPTYSPPPIAPVPTQSYSVRDNTGRIFHVSRAAYDELTAKEVEMSHMMDAINALKAARSEENRTIEGERATLDNTDQNALDQFNAQVDRYNAGSDTLDKDIDAYNAAVDDHNSYLVRVGTPAD